MDAETTQKLYEAFCEDLDAYCDGTLPDARRREIAAFLQASPQARATLQEFQQAHDLFANATWDVPEPTRTPSAQEILAAARTRPVARPSWRDRFAAWRAGLTWRSPAFAAAALLAVGAGVGWLALTASRTTAPQESAAVAPSSKPASPEAAPAAEAARAPESAPDATAKSVESPAATGPTAKRDAGAAPLSNAPPSDPTMPGNILRSFDRNDRARKDEPTRADTAKNEARTPHAPQREAVGAPQRLEAAGGEAAELSAAAGSAEKKASDDSKADGLIRQPALNVAPAPMRALPSTAHDQAMKIPLKAKESSDAQRSGRPESAVAPNVAPKPTEQERDTPAPPPGGAAPGRDISPEIGEAARRKRRAAGPNLRIVSLAVTVNSLAETRARIASVAKSLGLRATFAPSSTALNVEIAAPTDAKLEACLKRIRQLGTVSKELRAEQPTVQPGRPPQAPATPQSAPPNAASGGLIRIEVKEAKSQ